MRVAIDGTIGADTHSYTSRLARQLLQLAPEGIEWLPLVTAGDAPRWQGPPGVAPVVVKAPPTGALARKLWYNFALPRLLKRHGAQVFVGLQGHISTRKTVPQLLALYDAWHTAGLHSIPPALYPSSSQLPAMVVAAQAVFTDFAESLPAGLQQPQQHWHFTGAVWPAFSAQPAYNPSAAYFQGYPYFICPVQRMPLPALLEVLLAFSAFKKRMQCSMKLVLAGTPDNTSDWQEKYNTYRYRDEVLWLPYQQVQADWYAWLQGAWAVLLPHKAPCYRLLLDAVAARTAVVCQPHALHAALAGESLYIVSDEPGQALHQHMMALYKDETARRRNLQQMEQYRAAQPAQDAAAAIVQQLKEVL